MGAEVKRIEMLRLDRQPLRQVLDDDGHPVLRILHDFGPGQPVNKTQDTGVGGQQQTDARQPLGRGKAPLDDKAGREQGMKPARQALGAMDVHLRQSLPRIGWTYCRAMSQGKKIQVSWLTSVI